MPSGRVVEAFDVIEHVHIRMRPRAVHLLSTHSVFRDEKKLSMAALSQTLPDLLVELVTPLLAMSRWNCLLVYWSSSVGFNPRPREGAIPLVMGSQIMVGDLHHCQYQNI